MAFRFLAAGNNPDFRTIRDFSKRHGAARVGFFDQIIRVGRETGLVRLGRIAVDGTKIKANASKHKSMRYERMKEKEAATQRQVREIMKRAEEIDLEEDKLEGTDRRGDELPAEPAIRDGRLKQLREAKAALEAEARKRVVIEGKDPDQRKPPDNTQHNFTASESKIHRTGGGVDSGFSTVLSGQQYCQGVTRMGF